jgi:hypothetical protein
MSERISFLAYCIEIYKAAKDMSGKEVYELFSRRGVLDYVMDCAEALHTTGSQYTIQDIDRFLEATG